MSGDKEDINVRYLPTFEALFKRHYKPLRAYAFRFLNRKDMAEDVVQDVFLEIWDRRELMCMDDSEAVKSYLFKSVYNRSINLLKAKEANRFESLDDIDEDQIVENYLYSHTCNQEQSLLLKELEAEIANYVETLPPQCKHVFTLSRVQEMKNTEIAEQLGVSVKAVEKHISRALSGLKNYLNEKDLLCIIILFLRL